MSGDSELDETEDNSFVLVAPTLMRVVKPSCKSRRNTSGIRLVSPVTRLVAALTNGTWRPSGVIVEPRQPPFPLVDPSKATLTGTVVLLHKSRTKISFTPFVSTATRSLALLSKQA